jgi:hypothetical protein
VRSTLAHLFSWQVANKNGFGRGNRKDEDRVVVFLSTHNEELNVASTLSNIAAETMLERGYSDDVCT